MFNDSEPIITIIEWSVGCFICWRRPSGTCRPYDLAVVSYFEAQQFSLFLHDAVRVDHFATLLIGTHCSHLPVEMDHTPIIDVR